MFVDVSDVWTSFQQLPKTPEKQFLSTLLYSTYCAMFVHENKAEFKLGFNQPFCVSRNQLLHLEHFLCKLRCGDDGKL